MEMVIAAAGVIAVKVAVFTPYLVGSILATLDFVLLEKDF